MNVIEIVAGLWQVQVLLFGTLRNFFFLNILIHSWLNSWMWNLCIWRANCIKKHVCLYLYNLKKRIIWYTYSEICFSYLSFHFYLYFMYFQNLFDVTFFFFYKFIYLFLAALGLRCRTRAFSSCSERGLLFVAGLLIAVASLVEHRL